MVPLTTLSPGGGWAWAREARGGPAIAEPTAGRARPTMRDVARAAGVSLKTVSRVVNDEPGVGSGTSERVQRAISSLGFTRNDLARSLRHGRTSATLGLIIGDLGNPFYSSIARAVEEVAHARGHLLIAGSSEGDPQRERELVRVLAMRRVDGLLLVPSDTDHSALAQEQRRGLVVVFLDRPPVGVAADAVLIDNVGGACAATDHLVAHGHRRIGVVGDALSVATTAERLEGYRRGLESGGIPYEERLLRLGPSDVEGAEAAARELLALPDPPTAIFTTNNRNTIGVLRAVAGRSRRPALVGFDDFELADSLATPVSVVAHDPAEMGRQAARLLFERLDGEHGPPRRVMLPTRLLARGSGEVPP
jgi:LacI family transcriptional regulator